jgi:hypothetical protein
VGSPLALSIALIVGAAGVGSAAIRARGARPKAKSFN